MTIYLAVALACLAGGADDWPQFRGPTGDGVSSAAGIPTTWSETKNIAWKVRVPGRGRSSPVVLGDRIWMTTAVDAGPKGPGQAKPATAESVQAVNPLSLGVVCLQRTDGKLLYHVELFHVEKPEPIHPLNSYATPTPVVEAGKLWADFGAYGTACIDGETGRILWKACLAVDHQLGPGSSPVIWKDRLLLVRDGCDQQYVAALEKDTGREAWRTSRPPIEAESGQLKKSFSTPLVVEVGGQAQAVIPGPHWVIAYDPASGREIWRVRHGTGYSIAPRPIFGHGMVYIGTGGYVSQLWAIRVDGHGDVTDTHVAWKATSQIPLMSSPLLVSPELYFVSDSGIVSCVDALSGKLHWRERIGGNFCASPVWADGRVYLFDREGKTTVIGSGKKFVRLAENQFEGPVVASPAVVGQAIFIRTDSHLYCVRSVKSETSGLIDNRPPEPK